MKICVLAVSAALVALSATSSAFAQERMRQFRTELRAQGFCQADPVVWVNRNNKTGDVSLDIPIHIG
jgi:hypothetical protein